MTEPEEVIENTTRTRKVEPTIPADAYGCLERLAKIERYGSNATEVARYLLIRALDDLTRAGVLPAEPVGKKES